MQELHDADGVDPDCVFCLIAANRAPAREVMRTPDVVAFLPDVPAVAGHTLIVPISHIPDITALDTTTGRALSDATLTVAAAAKHATGAQGLNIIQSNGECAGQTVFHLHIHVVPRAPGDRMPELWPVDAVWGSADLDRQADAVRSALETHEQSPSQAK